MRRIDCRLIIGGLLILAGILALLDNLGLIPSAMDVFWALVFGVAGAVFLYMFVASPSNWWAAFPAFTLLGMGASALLPEALEAWDGMVFLGSIGLGFWAVYLTGRERWWAIIPGGVLLTLGAVSALDEIVPLMETGGVFFIGLGITFLLVAILPGPPGRTWALFPAAALTVLGLLLGTPFAGLTDFIWPLVLLAAGVYLIWMFLRARQRG